MDKATRQPRWFGWFGWFGDKPPVPALPDAADMGTAFGLEMSLMPDPYAEDTETPGASAGSASSPRWWWVAGYKAKRF